MVEGPGNAKSAPGNPLSADSVKIEKPRSHSFRSPMFSRTKAIRNVHCGFPPRRGPHHAVFTHVTLGFPPRIWRIFSSEVLGSYAHD
jgi:hypothetical protein